MNDIFDGFQVSVFFDGQDYMAYFSELPHISAAGDAPQNALSELQIAWETMKESYKKDGEEIPKPVASGRFYHAMANALMS